MKLLNILLIISLALLIYGADYPDAHHLNLDDADSTIDGKKVGESDVFYKEENGEISIKTPGTYIVSGRLTGQLEVNLEDEKGKIILVFDGAKITSKTTSAVLIKSAYEFYTQNGTNNTGKISLEDAKALDFKDIGAKIIIADDSVNTITGSHSEKHDGAISSKVSLVISGEEKGNGVLNIVGDSEGIELKKHLLIDGGIINIAAQDDGINSKTDNMSVLKIKAGKLNINAGLAREGDGVDSNGYILVEGGTIIAASQITFEDGLDSNRGLVIDGGDVIAVGSGMDDACTLGKQPTMNLKFAEQVSSKSKLVIKDSDNKEVLSFSPETLGFMEGTTARNYSAATISSSKLKMKETYKIYVDDKMLGNGGAEEAIVKIWEVPTDGGRGGWVRPPKEDKNDTKTETKKEDEKEKKEEKETDEEKLRKLLEASVNYPNPLILERADPYIVDGKDGFFYFTASYPAFGSSANGYDRIILRKSNTVLGLKDAKEKTIWKAHDDGLMSRHIWAPEMHKIGGAWYMFFAAGTKKDVWAIRPYALKNEGDPYDGTWKELGQVQAADGDSSTFTSFSLDMTYFENNNKHYLIWAEIKGDSSLFMAEINPSNPTKLITKPILLTKPEFNWELIGHRVNEGPSVLKTEKMIYVFFSASGTGPEYCMGRLEAPINANLMDVKSWKKITSPVLSTADLNGESGPGHNSFVVDENGDLLLVYHARPASHSQKNCGTYNAEPLYDPCRHCRIKRVVFDQNGVPILNAKNSAAFIVGLGQEKQIVGQDEKEEEEEEEKKEEHHHRGGWGGGFSRGSRFSGCDKDKTMTSKEFEISYTATTFKCVQLVKEEKEEKEDKKEEEKEKESKKDEE